MSISIKTENYTKGQKFEIDGMEWEYRAPGAGVTLELSKASRKSAEIDKKIKNGTATDADTEKQAELIEAVFDFYNSILRDGTKDNKHVKAWLNETSMEAISAIVQDIQAQSE